MLRRLLTIESASFLILWVFLTVFGRSSLLRDPGAFWHTVVGDQILTQRALVRTDTFSFTAQGERWLSGHWLAECCMAIFHRIGGLDGLLLLATTTLAGLFTIIIWRFRSVGAHWALAAVLTTLIMASSSYHFHIRTHLWTLLFMATSFSLLCDYEARRIDLARLAWFLVPTFLIWSNMHAGVLGGLATLCVVVAGWMARPYLPGLMRGPQVNPIKLLALLAACVAAVFCHPLGREIIHVWLGLIDSEVVQRLMDEHRGLLESGQARTVLLLGLVYVAMLVGVVPQTMRVVWLVPVVWFVLTWGRIRHGPLFAITAAIAMADMLPHLRWRQRLAERGSRLLRLGEPPVSGPIRPTVLLGLGVILISLTIQMTGLRVPLLGRGWAQLDTTRWPVELLPQLNRLEAAQRTEIPIFNEMLFGGFLIYYTPHLKLFIDDRCELYGERRLKEYLEAHSQTKDFENGMVAQWSAGQEFNFALTLTGSSIDTAFLSLPDWEPVQQTVAATLHRRKARHDEDYEAEGDEQHDNG